MSKNERCNSTVQLIDTHTHFDVADFDTDRVQLAQNAFQNGVKDLILIGFLANRFAAMAQVAETLNHLNDVPRCHLAPGLHPFYIEQHQQSDVQRLADFLTHHPCIAIGEIGLDRFADHHKHPSIQARQVEFFSAQLELAQQHNLPVMLHIRKAHGETLAILKQHKFKQGGIAHAFSGGVEEAKAFVRLGFKIGITGQITNPNAKRLHTVVHALAPQDLVIETDCPDMTPLCCQIAGQTRTRNTPANLIYVLEALANILNLEVEHVAEIIWANSHQVLDF